MLAVVDAYGDDVAEAISKYGDNFTEMSKYYDEGTVLQAKRFFAEADDYILKNPLKIELPKQTFEGGADDFVGILKGEKVTLPNVKGQTIQYTKVSTENLAELRKAFNTTDRKEFLKFLSNDENMLQQLKTAGLTDTDILKMKDGYVPTGYQVHHKIPLDGGGTNSFDNLVLIKNDPYHKVITNTQNSVTSGLDAGKTITIDNWPVPDGYISERIKEVNYDEK